MIIITPIVVAWMLLTILTETGVSVTLYNALGKRLPLQKVVAYLTCWKCATFWLSLSIGSGFVNACISAFIAYVVELIIERIQE
jgi:hypothetical protein